MRRLFILALALAAAPVAVSATELNSRMPVPKIQHPVQAVYLPHAEMIQVPVRVDQRSEAESTAAAMQPMRTTWWWIVAAVVLGGIIVAAIT